MVYMAGDNNLAQAAVDDIEEMKEIGSTSDVNIVVQADFSSVYAQGTDGQSHRYYIQKGSVQDFPLGSNYNFADPNLLKDFVIWAKNNYPADHYLLILWDHGSGWRQKGILADDTSNQIMNIDKMSDALTQTGIHFDIIDFDACLMAMYEVAYSVKDISSYLVFSEQTEPGDGDAYDLFLSELVKNPSMSPSNLAKIIASTYKSFYEQQSLDTGVTKSVLDVSQFDNLDRAIREFVGKIKPQFSQWSSYIAQAAQNSQTYQVESFRDIYDLFSHVREVINDTSIISTIDSILNIVSNSVIISNEVYNPQQQENSIFQTSGVKNSHGISIYLPLSQDTSQQELSAYANLRVSQGENSWYQLICSILGINNNSSQLIQAVKGDFTWAIFWFDVFGNFPNTSDVDLFIVEPCHNCEDGLDIYAPYMGSSTPNGYFSPDSRDSGWSYEDYTAKSLIEPGTYMAIATLNCNSGVDYLTYADSYFAVIDPSSGYNDWTLLSHRAMDCSNPAPDPSMWTESVINNIIYGYYSNWWIIYYTQRVNKDKNGLGIKMNLHKFLGE